MNNDQHQWTNLYDRNRNRPPGHELGTTLPPTQTRKTQTVGIPTHVRMIPPTTTPMTSRPGEGPRPRPPSETPLRILGLAADQPDFFPDDLSTIAHETVGGDTTSTTHHNRGPTSQYQYQHQHRTPEKKVIVYYGKNYINNKDDGDDDEEATQPETPPPKNVRTTTTTPSSSSRPRKSSSSSSSSSCRFCRLMTSAVCVGTIILGTVGFLSYILYGIRQEPDNGNGNSSSSSSSNSEKATIDKEWEEWPGTLAPDHSSMNETTVEWVERSLLEQASSFYSSHVDSLTTDPSSVQSHVVHWLAQDPSIRTYTGPTMVQRYALGVVYGSLVGNGNSTFLVGTETGEAWMTYTDECDWPMTKARPSIRICDDNGVVQSLQLDDSNLKGVVAAELGLLSRLTMISLTTNQIGGPIPTTIGLLTALERLNLPRNQLVGSLPTELGLLTRLGTYTQGSPPFRLMCVVYVRKHPFSIVCFVVCAILHPAGLSSRLGSWKQSIDRHPTIGTWEVGSIEFSLASQQFVHGTAAGGAWGSFQPHSVAARYQPIARSPSRGSWKAHYLERIVLGGE